VNEPDNHTAWLDQSDDVWVRVDECAIGARNWWPLRNGVGNPSRWDWVDRQYGPFAEASPSRTAEAVEQVFAR
jgi:hypothetical protein